MEIKLLLFNNYKLNNLFLEEKSEGYVIVASLMKRRKTNK